MKKLTSEEICEILEVQANNKCAWETAIEIWNEDTTRYENGE